MLLPSVFVVLDRLEVHDVRYWIAGGWGVDALVGRETRQHRDLRHGVLSGRRVPCLSVERQLEFHTGYEPRPQDLHDIALLQTLLP